MRKFPAFHDAGHGAANTGIIHGGIIEKDWTLEMVLDAQSHLKGFGPQYASRIADVPLSLSERAAMAHAVGALIGFSHHVNGAFHPRVKVGSRMVEVNNHPGVKREEPIYDPPEPNTALHGLMCFARADDPIGLEVGGAIMRAAPFGLLRREQACYVAEPNSWTRHTYNVLRPYGDTPAVLIEWGFATAPRDVKILTSPKSLPARLVALEAGMARFIEIT